MCGTDAQQKTLQAAQGDLQGRCCRRCGGLTVAALAAIC
jgi:hypothetical protein